MAHNLHNSDIRHALYTGPEFAAGQLDASLSAFDRRTFLKLMSATLAAAGAAQFGCSKPQPPEIIVPYVRSPEHVIPGLSSFYASTLPTSGYVSGFGRGILVESHEGRPTKIEGNPNHPSSLGSTDLFMQAAVLQLYDASRSPTLLKNRQPAAWGTILSTLSQFIAQRGGPLNIRIRLLTRTLTSPTLAAQLQSLHAAFPRLIHHMDDTPGTLNSRAGQARAFSRPFTLRYNFSRATRILSLDNHFLSSLENPGAIRHIRDFAASRHSPISNPSPVPNSFPRLYVAESSLTYTGARADHRLAVAPTAIPHIAAAITSALLNAPDTTQLPPDLKKWISAAAADLQSHPKESLILVGECQPPEVHALAAALNAHLQAPGNTIDYLDAIDIVPAGDFSLSALTKALHGNDVELLIFLDSNPAFTAPADLDFANALGHFTADPNHLALHLGAYVDETALLCPLHIPLSHSLESWADFRAHDGTASITQPLIQPLWNSKSPTELFAALLALAAEQSSAAGHNSNAQAVTLKAASSYDLVRRHWFDQWKDLSTTDREHAWRKSLRDGIIENTVAIPIALSSPDSTKLFADLQHALQATPGSIELTFRLDPTIADGESGWANHPWLQELPKPFSHTTWDNLAIISPVTAVAIGINDDPHEARETVPIIRITSGGSSIEIPVWIQFGHPDNTIALNLGGGHAIGDIQKDVGTNVYPLRTTAALWRRTGPDLHIENIGRRTAVSCTQAIQFQEGRDIVRTRQLDEIVPAAPQETKVKTVPLSLYKDYAYTGYKWGMVVDLSACIGCNACVVACQSENNIPTVGKEQVRRGRAMHWIRIDTYIPQPGTIDISKFGGQTFQFQPMLCQHCENAPCELVCPVEATSHSEEGINEMTYNRCVGTRYCSNNCPYKVRRFNFYDYNNQNASHGIPSGDAALAAMQKNPNVTVRARGVMEKCTYCIQRINRARLQAKRDWSRSEQPLSAVKPPEMRTPSSGFSAPSAPSTESASEPDRSPPIEPLPRLDFQTACQQACPAQAITFGDLNDADAPVTRLKVHSLNYGVLVDLNTQPRTSYLERITNPNPALSITSASAHNEYLKSKVIKECGGVA